MNEPKTDKEFIELPFTEERLWATPYHLKDTRTTFLRFGYLSSWEHAKIEFSDGNIPFDCYTMFSMTLEDLKHLLKMTQSMINALKKNS